MHLCGDRCQAQYINGIRHSVDLDDKDGTYPVKSAAAGALGVCAEKKRAEQRGQLQHAKHCAMRTKSWSNVAHSNGQDTKPCFVSAGVRIAPSNCYHVPSCERRHFAF